MEKTEKLATSVDEDTKKSVRVRAARRDIDMAEWIREAIDEKLAREDEEGESKTGAAAD
jgi:plasmid stability protein